MCGNAQPITVEKIVSYGIQPYVVLSYVFYVLSNYYEVNVSFTHSLHGTVVLPYNFQNWNVLTSSCDISAFIMSE